MVGFVDPHKLVVRRSAFSLALPNAQDGGETEGGVESKGLKCQFSHMEGDLDLQKSLNWFPFQKGKHQRKKTIVLKNENEKNEKARKNWVDNKILHLIVPRKKMKFENWMLGPQIRPQAF